MGLKQSTIKHKNIEIYILQLCTAIDAMYIYSCNNIDNTIINTCLKLSKLMQVRAVEIYKIADMLKFKKQLTPDNLKQSIIEFKERQKYLKFNKKVRYAKAPLVMYTINNDNKTEYPYPQCQKSISNAINKTLDSLAELNDQIKKYGKVAKSEMYLELQDLV